MKIRQMKRKDTERDQRKQRLITHGSVWLKERKHQRLKDDR